MYSMILMFITLPFLFSFGIIFNSLCSVFQFTYSYGDILKQSSFFKIRQCYYVKISYNTKPKTKRHNPHIMMSLLLNNRLHPLCHHIIDSDKQNQN